MCTCTHVYAHVVHRFVKAIMYMYKSILIYHQLQFLPPVVVNQYRNIHVHVSVPRMCTCTHVHAHTVHRFVKAIMWLYTQPHLELEPLGYDKYIITT